MSDDLKAFAQAQNERADNVFTMESGFIEDFTKSVHQSESGEDVEDVGIIEDVQPIEEEGTAPEPQQDDLWGDYDLNRLPKDWVPDNDNKSNPEWYQKKYVDLLKTLTDDKTTMTFAQKHLEALGIENAEEFIEHYKGFKNNAEEYIKLHLPQYAEQYGVGAILTEEQMLSKVGEKMTELYGENYMAMYSKDEVSNPSSLSAKMERTVNETLAALKQQNQEAQDKYNQKIKEINQVPEITDDYRKEAYKDALESGFTLEEAKAIEEKIIKEKWHPTMKDLLIAQNFTKFEKAAYEKGLRDGRSGVKSKEYSALRTIDKSKEKEEETKPKASDKSHVSIYDFYSTF
jgi:hypothetical protein